MSNERERHNGHRTFRFVEPSVRANSRNVVGPLMTSLSPCWRERGAEASKKFRKVSSRRAFGHLESLGTDLVVHESLDASDGLVLDVLAIELGAAVRRSYVGRPLEAGLEHPQQGIEALAVTEFEEPAADESKMRSGTSWGDW
jgi:hypothetical protein